MERGDIYLVSLDPTRGHEQQGRRPVLVVSPGAFNQVTKVPIVLPITTGGSFARTAGFAVSLRGAGTKTIGVVRCDQPRALDIGARDGRKLETMPAGVMDEVLAKLSAIFEQRIVPPSPAPLISARSGNATSFDGRIEGVGSDQTVYGMAPLHAAAVAAIVHGPLFLVGIGRVGSSSPGGNRLCSADERHVDKE